MSVTDETRAVREAVGLLDRSARGFLLLTGFDRYAWLQGMVTHDVRLLERGEPVLRACVLDATGHMQADVTLVPTPDGLLLDTNLAVTERLLRLLDGFIITEDVEIADRTGARACFSAQGPQATEAWMREKAGPGPCTMVPADHTGAGGFDLYLPAEASSAVRDRLIRAGARPVGPEAAETLRIEAGLPRWGAELDESVIPLEAGLEATHVSDTKGCYVGQEIIARIQSRGHTNRALTGLRLAKGDLPAKGDRLYASEGETERDAGWITSAVYSPTLDSPIALAYVRHEHRAPGTALRIAGKDGEYQAVPRAVVTPLPFVGRAEA